MRISFLHILLAIPVLFVGAPLLAEPSSAPSLIEPLPAARYASMAEHAPFVLASAIPKPTPSTEPQASFAKDLILSGAVRLAAGDYVTIATKDKQKQYSLRTGESYNGIELVSVEWSPEAGKTRATLKNGNDYATIGFDEATVKSSSPSANHSAGNPTQAAPTPPSQTLPSSPPPASSGTNAAPPRSGRIIRSHPPQ